MEDEVWYDLPDGRRLESCSEDYRRFCEAWSILRLAAEGRITIGGFLKRVERERGAAGRKALWAEIENAARHKGVQA